MQHKDFMSENSWLFSFLTLSILFSWLGCRYSKSKLWKKIIGTICILPVIYILTGSFYTPYEFANPLVYISVPLGWLSAWMFFSKKRAVFYSTSLALTIAICLINTMYCHPKMLEREDEWYNNYRLEQYKSSKEHQDN